MRVRLMLLMLLLLSVVYTSTCEEAREEVPTNRPLTKEEARRWSSELVGHFMQHPIYKHRLMSKLSGASYPDHVAALVLFSQQVFAFARDFRSYLGLTISKLKCCQDVKENLMDHIREENGLLTEAELKHADDWGIKREWIEGIPHIDLWGRMLKTLNIPPAYLQEALKLNAWTLDTCTRQSSTVGLVIVLSIELWAGSMGVEIIPALRKASIDPKLGIFFDLHALVDTEDHIGEIDQDIISALTNQVPENSLEELKHFMTVFQDQRLEFWNKMDEVMMAMKPKKLPVFGEGPLCYGPRMCAALDETRQAGVSVGDDSYDHSAAFHARILSVFRERKGLSELLSL